MNLSIIVFGLLQHTPLSKMKKIIPLSIFILSALVFRAQEFDDRLFVKFSESELIEMQANQICLLYTSPSPRDRQKSRMPSSA